MGLDTARRRALDPGTSCPSASTSCAASSSAHREGTKEEKIYALNLDYMAKNFEPGGGRAHPAHAPAMQRRRIAAVDFLRAKAHLLTNEALRRKLTEPRVQVVGYGKGAERKELQPGPPSRSAATASW